MSELPTISVMRSGLCYVRQTRSTASFSLFVGADAALFDSQKLNIIESATAAGAQMKIEAHVIGQSHFFVASVPSGKVVVAELLGCVELEELGLSPTVTRALSGRVCNDVARLESDAITALESTLNLHGADHMRRALAPSSLPKPEALARLCVPFPGPQTPRTIVEVAVEGPVAEVRTLHEYATRDGAIECIESVTTIELR